MNQGARTWAWIGLAWAFAQPLWAGENAPWVEAAANTQSVRLGGRFVYTLTAGAEGAAVRLPGRQALLPGCRLLDYTERDVSFRHEGYQARQGRYELVAFAIPEILIPAQIVRFAQESGEVAEATSLPIRLAIVSMNPESGLALINPRPPRRIGWWWEWWWLALLLALATGWGWRLRGARTLKLRQPVRPKDPVREANQALENIAAGRGEVAAKTQIREIENTLYRFLAWRLSLTEGKTTLEAIRAAMAAAGRPDEAVVFQIQEFEKLSAFAKYATVAVDAVQVSALLELALSIVQSCRPQPKAGA
jgi:hypothetical protein